MSCQTCKNRICQKSGRPCKEVEKNLPKNHTGRNPKEVSNDPYLLNRGLAYDEKGRLYQDSGFGFRKTCKQRISSTDGRYIPGTFYDKRYAKAFYKVQKAMSE